MQSRTATLNRPSPTCSYRFARSESKQEIWAGPRDSLRQKWRSIGALGREPHLRPTSNFGRLRKSYATMRKSFRLQLGERAEVSAPLEDGSGGKNIVAQLGAGAARLLRNIYPKGAESPLGMDSIRSTDGSFKVLASMAHYDSAPVHRKSAAELEIEQRLRRSKRRVLRSARYVAPNCREACAEINMEELEAIKRDNLRLATRYQSLTGARAYGAAKEALCSCRKLYGSSELEGEACSCNPSRATGGGSSPSFLADEQRGVELQVSAESERAEGGIDTSTCAAERDNQDQGRAVSGESRASSGFVGDKSNNESCDELLEATSKRLAVDNNVHSSNCNDDNSNHHDDDTSMGEFIFDDHPTEPAGELENLCGGEGELSVVCPSVGESSSSRSSTCEQLAHWELPVYGVESEGDYTERACGGSQEGESGSRGVEQAAADDYSLLEQQRQLSPARNGSSRLGGVRHTQQVTGQRSDVMQTLDCCGSRAPSYLRRRAFSVAAETSAAIELDEHKSQGIEFARLSNGEREVAIGAGGRRQVIAERRLQRDRIEPHRDQIQDRRHRRRQRALQIDAQVTAPGASKQTAETGVMLTEADVWLAEAARRQLAEATGARRDYLLAPEVDEHLYASISGASKTPSPEREYRQRRDMSLEEYYYKKQQSQYQYELQFNKQQLFEKQLNSNLDIKDNQEHGGVFYHQQQQQHRNSLYRVKPKRSLLSRIKQMIVPNGNKTQSKTQSSLELEPQTLESRRSRWQKSATLSSKSTQNLLGASMRCLSSSRKSINLTSNLDHSERRPSLMNGFLTLGRRSNAEKGARHELAVSAIFRADAPDRYHLGSADSLPSADSGLSCSNLQHSSSSDENYPALRTSNLYSRVPPQLSHELSSAAPEEEAVDERQVVGRARALVDCNPCAYDKEALVFKRGDIIDILERDQSGTWVGRCNAQIGHFKFINVIELPEAISDEHDLGQVVSIKAGAAEQQAAERRPASSLWSPAAARKVSDKTISGTYVTKLEIRSNSNEPQTSCRQQPEPARPVSSSPRAINRRSLSMNTIDNHQSERYNASEANVNLVRSSGPVEIGNLSGSNETIMSSLEQLLFAIGLAGEQATLSKRPNTVDGARLNTWQPSAAEAEEAEESSYLEVLNRGGISNLDSFSAIDDWHKLEQMGIVDDEHQRRLLMAAKIIRQASQAARLDFVERSQGQKQQQRRQTTTDSPSCEPGKSSSLTCKSTDNAVNEPVYANLTRSATQGVEPREVGGPLIVGRVHDLDPIDGHEEQVCMYTRAGTGAAAGESGDHRRWPTLSGAKALSVRRPERRINSINQFVVGHYHSTRALSTQAQNVKAGQQDTSLVNSKGNNKSTNEEQRSTLACNDRVNANCSQADGWLPSPPSRLLTRGYSVRVNARNNGQRKSVASTYAALAGSQTFHQTNDLQGGDDCCDTKEPRALPPLPSSSPPSTFRVPGQRSRFNSSFVDGGEVKSRKGSQQQQLDRNGFEQELEDESHEATGSDAEFSALQQQHHSNKHINHHQHLQEANARQHLNLGAQINSKSAYDLRLDLSHFFS